MRALWQPVLIQYCWWNPDDVEGSIRYCERRVLYPPRRMNLKFYCPVCGEIWAERTLDGYTAWPLWGGKETRWMCEEVPCERHGYASLLSDEDVHNEFEWIPAELIVREAEILCRDNASDNPPIAFCDGGMRWI